MKIPWITRRSLAAARDGGALLKTVKRVDQSARTSTVWWAAGRKRKPVRKHFWFPPDGRTGNYGSRRIYYFFFFYRLRFINFPNLVIVIAYRRSTLWRYGVRVNREKPNNNLRVRQPSSSRGRWKFYTRLFKRFSVRKWSTARHCRHLRASREAFR